MAVRRHRGDHAAGELPRRGFLRALFLVPYALPVYAAVITWAFMFQRDNGLVNHVLHDQLGITDQPSFWLIGDNSIYALIVVSVWKGWPFAFLMLMAALQNIPRELYEAAAIDGAGVRQQIRRITMPSLRPVNQVLVLVLFLWTFNDFNTPYVLFGKAAPRTRTSSRSTSTSRPSSPGTSAPVRRCPSCCCCSSWS